MHINRPLRHHRIHPIRHTPHMLINPRQLDLQLLRRKTHRPQHTQTPRPRHRNRHITTMSKRKNRVLDTEHVTKRCVHWLSPV